jgi:hypothetical protein
LRRPLTACLRDIASANPVFPIPPAIAGIGYILSNAITSTWKHLNSIAEALLRFNTLVPRSQNSQIDDAIQVVDECAYETNQNPQDAARP